MSGQLAAELVKHGVCFACASCKHKQSAVKAQSSLDALCGKPCNDPIANLYRGLLPGLAWPERDSLTSDDVLASHCAITGAPADYQVSLNGRRIGLSLLSNFHKTAASRDLLVVWAATPAVMNQVVELKGRKVLSEVLSEGVE